MLHPIPLSGKPVLALTSHVQFFLTYEQLKKIDV